MSAHEERAREILSIINDEPCKHRANRRVDGVWLEGRCEDCEIDEIAAALRSAEESAARRCAEIIESYCGRDHRPREACWRYVYAHEGGEKIRSEFGLGEEGA